jgi:PAS domain S-box-containing protein
MRTRDAIRIDGARVHQIFLANLAGEDLECLITDSLHCSPDAAAPLVELVLEKTAGNPFFVIQFLSALAEEGLLTLEHRSARWTWDLARIRAKGYTDNVVDLMIGKVGRLPGYAQETLQLLACLGPGAPSDVLAIVRETDEGELRRDLEEALASGLVLYSEGSYRFLHDRVQEAAYAVMPEAQRAEVHLRIGRLLFAHTPLRKREDKVFEIVNQLNRGTTLISAPDEKEQLAELNLMAGKRAKASTAYSSALPYLVAGAALLAEDRRDWRPDLTFALELHAAECRFLIGDVASAEAQLASLASRAADPLDRAKVASLGIDLYMTLDRNDRAVDVCLDYLRHLGIEWTSHPSNEAACREYDRTWSLVGSRDIGTLIGLPLMREPESVATMDVLTKALPPALYTDENLLCLLVCRMIDLTLEHGNTDGSCMAYAWLGRITALRFENYQGASRFGRLGRELVEQPGLERFKARAYITFANWSMPWTQHLRQGQDLLRRACDIAKFNGDITFAAFSGNNLITNLLAAGDSLGDVQLEAERGLAFARKTGFNAVSQIIATQLGLVRTLRGLTAIFGCFDDEEFDESRIELAFSTSPEHAGAPIAAFRYWTRKLQARFLAGDYPTATDAALKAQRLLWTLPSTLDSADAHFYGALSHAATCDATPVAQRQRHLDALALHHRQLRVWADKCAENFQDRAALVGAEIARLEGRELDAMRLYEEAIRSARDNGFPHNEAVACEVAARFYAARGFDDIARLHVRNARYGYSRWGADGKVRQLEDSHPWLADDARAATETGSIGAPVESLDLATVVDVSRAVSSELVLDKLLQTLLRTAIQQAGARRGLLVVVDGGQQRIEAEALVDGDAVHVQLLDAPATDALLPEAVLMVVLRTQEPVILDDAAALDPFSADPYIRRTGARSVFCLPLVAHAKLAGVLYLENPLAPRVFVPARTAVLKLVASQAAIALENARLYRDLAEREARIRRLVDANIVGVVIWELGGRIVEANDAFLNMLGFERADLVAPGLHWTDITPPEWLEREQGLAPELETTGALQPLEKEYFRKDGSRVPVLVGVARFEGSENQGVACVVDLSERKRAQEALDRASAELARVSRMTAMSALTASIAHEVNQPLAGIITNAGTCLRMLDASPANVEGARETARRTLRDGNRAADVITRLRALFGKGDSALEPVDLNAAVREVIALSSDELQRARVVLHAELASELPILLGDRVQLQQVIDNLVRNACEAMADVHDRPRRLSITTESCSDDVRITVCDAGVGLPPKGGAALFEAFHTTKTGGMGIGLFVSRSIIAKHGGRFWAEPNEGGIGASFIVALPFAADPSASPTADR